MELIGKRFRYNSKHGVSKWTHVITDTMICCTRYPNRDGIVPVLFIKGNNAWYEAKTVLITLYDAVPQSKK